MIPIICSPSCWCFNLEQIMISKCSDEEFSVVCDGVLEGIKKLLQKNHKEVKAALEATSG